MGNVSRLYSYTGDPVGNGADTNNDTVLTMTVPANTLTDDGQVLHIFVAGNCANNADLKYAGLNVNGVSQIETILVPNSGSWVMEGYFVRQGSDGAQKSKFAVGKDGQNLSISSNLITGLDWTADTVIGFECHNASNPIANSVTVRTVVITLME